MIATTSTADVTASPANKTLIFKKNGSSDPETIEKN